MQRVAHKRLIPDTVIAGEHLERVNQFLVQSYGNHLKAERILDLFRQFRRGFANVSLIRAKLSGLPGLHRTANFLRAHGFSSHFP